MESRNEVTQNRDAGVARDLGSVVRQDAAGQAVTVVLPGASA